jgi:hypothetical protein
MVESTPADEVTVGASAAMTADRYLATRLDQYQQWYDRKSVKTKAIYLRMRTISVVGGVLVPVVININGLYAKIAATVISLIVAGCVGLESVYRYRDQWKNYRSTEQALGHQRVYFQTRTGDYEGLSADAAFRLLVERVESAIAAENAATLNVMTLLGQGTNDETIAALPLPSTSTSRPPGA